MVRWSEFEDAAPELAAGERRLLLQHGLGLGFLATIRADGSPRIHPFCPILAEGGLWGFIGPSPKLRDLQRDGRCAIHSFPPVDVDDEFMIAADAREETDAEVVARVRDAYTAPIQSHDETLVEFHLRSAMLAVYETRPSWPPAYSVWRA